LKRRYGAESFYVDNVFNPLPELIIKGQKISNIEYNAMWGVSDLYSNFDMSQNYDKIHLVDRIPKVMELARDGKHKLQYFQLYNTFDEIMN
jgi:hypothetical protein